MKKLVIGIIILALIGIGIFAFTREGSETVNNTDNMTDDTMMEDGSMTEDDSMMEEKGPEEVIGQSVDGRDITAYHYGSGDTEILLVGGIHGGYSWNTSLVAYEAMDYFEANEDTLPENITVTVIPALNPDGLMAVTGTTGKFSANDVSATTAERTAARFNANDVDLNRNFDCDWQENAVWQSTAVSGGSEAFSEPEARALRDYVEANSPDAVVVYYAASGGVFASDCYVGVLAETNELTDLYADASGYKAFQEFNFYEITGDAVNWLASERIPAISVLLTNHTDTEWSKNRAGIEALIEYYGN